MSGGNFFVCSDHLSADFMCRMRRAASRVARVSLHVSCGLYLPGRIGIRSLMGRPKTHIAEDNLVSLSGQFLYCRIARWNGSTSRSPLGAVLTVIMRLTVFILRDSCCEGTRLMTGDGGVPIV